MKNGPVVGAIVLNQNWRLRSERFAGETRFRPVRLDSIERIGSGRIFINMKVVAAGDAHAGKHVAWRLQLQGQEIRAHRFGARRPQQLPHWSGVEHFRKCPIRRPDSFCRLPRYRSLALGLTEPIRRPAVVGV